MTFHTLLSKGGFGLKTVLGIIALTKNYKPSPTIKVEIRPCLKKAIPFWKKAGFKHDPGLSIHPSETYVLLQK